MRNIRVKIIGSGIQSCDDKLIGFASTSLIEMSRNVREAEHELFWLRLTCMSSDLTCNTKGVRYVDFPVH